MLGAIVIGWSFLWSLVRTVRDYKVEIKINSNIRLNALLIFVGGIRSGFLSGSDAAAEYSSSSSSTFCLHTAITAAPPPTPPPITLPVPAPHKSCRRWFRCRRDRTRSAHITAAAATADTKVMAKRPATTGVSRKRSSPPAPTADEPVKPKLL